MEKALLLIFFILIVSIPFLYRFVRVGRIGWFVKTTSSLANDKNYNTAETLTFAGGSGMNGSEKAASKNEKAP